VRRQRQNTRKIYTEDRAVKNVNMKGLYFDGKRDVTFVNVKANEKYFRRKVTEEHVTIVSEPDSDHRPIIVI